MASETSTTSTTSPSKNDRDATVLAVNHLIQGKRHLLVQDITSAVNSLQEACRILAACYGEVADECGDAYFHYGSALLELSRKESGILGNEKVGSGSEEEESDESDDDDDDKEDEDESENEDDEDDKTSEITDQDAAGVTAKKASEKGGTGEADGNKSQTDNAGANVTDDREITDKVESESSPKMEESKKSLKKDDSEAKSEDLEESKKADEDTVPEKKEDLPVPGSGDGKHAAVEQKTCPSVPSSTTEVPSTSADSSQPGTSQDKPKEDDEVTTLQLSWEILELSKVIFKRQSESSREMQLRLAQVHLKLGEVAMESENYKQSIEDLLECFKIQHALLAADDRGIAEVYYQLGLAYTFDLQFDLAIESFKNAVQTLRDRISNIQKVADCNGAAEKDVDAAYDAKKEIEELNELLPEILEKITDTEDLKKNALKLPEELIKDLIPEQCKEVAVAVDSTTGLSPSKIPKPVTNIAHLVRKKRKPEEGDVTTSSSCDATEVKRPRPDNDEPNSVTRSGDPSSTVGNKINGTTPMDCIPLAGKSAENSDPMQSDAPTTSN